MGGRREQIEDAQTKAEMPTTRGWQDAELGANEPA